MFLFLHRSSEVSLRETWILLPLISMTCSQKTTTPVRSVARPPGLTVYSGRGGNGTLIELVRYRTTVFFCFYN